MGIDSVKSGFTSAKRHITVGINAMLPLMIVGALGMALGSFVPAGSPVGDLFSFMNEVGLNHFDIFVAMAIGQSITGKVGLVTGFILGYYSNQLGLGIFGGLVVGFLAGAGGVLFNRLKLEGSTKALLALVVVPLVSTVVGYLVITYLVAAPLSFIQNALITFLTDLSGQNAVILAIVIGLMLGFDLGGPINKTAGIFVMVSLTEGIRGPITYAMCAYMLPSVAAGLAVLLDRKKVLFDEDEHTQALSVLVMGCLGLSEPALPLMFSDMKFMVPANMACSALVCALLAGLGCESTMALSFLDFVFMNKPIEGVLSFVACLALLVVLILFRRRRLAAGTAEA